MCSGPGAQRRFGVADSCKCPLVPAPAMGSGSALLLVRKLLTQLSLRFVFPGESCICECALISFFSTNCFGLFLFTKSLDVPASDVKPGFGEV